MDTEGVFAPESRSAVLERYAELAPAAREVIRASTRQMGFDATEYDERVTEDVRQVAQDAIFASLLRVRVGSRDEFDQWRATYDGEVIETGGEHVDNSVWHAPPWSETAIAATFQNEREAAVGTLRRQAFGRLYSEVIR